MILLAATSHANVFAYAKLTLDVADLARLLRTWTLFKLFAGNKDYANLYALEFDDGSVEYGADLTDDAAAEAALLLHAWFPCHTTVELHEAAAYCVAHLHVTEEGVYWSAEAKHSDERFETPVLSWAEVERLHAKLLKEGDPCTSTT